MAKVLVAEDDALLSSLLLKHLQKENFETRAVYDGAAAIDEVRNWKPDVLLLDILMPVKNGWDVLSEIKADQSIANTTAVVIISNLSAEEDIARAKSFGVDNFLVKATTSLSQIVEKVQRAMNR